MVPKVFELLKFYCITKDVIYIDFKKGDLKCNLGGLFYLFPTATSINNSSFDLQPAFWSQNLTTYTAFPAETYAGSLHKIIMWQKIERHVFAWAWFAKQRPKLSWQKSTLAKPFTEKNE